MTNDLTLGMCVNELQFCEDDLRLALRRGEFEPYFQPIVGADGIWRGAEILMRWRHPQHGVLPPSDFLMPLEKAGLLVAATRDILACAARHWRRASPPQHG